MDKLWTGLHIQHVRYKVEDWKALDDTWRYTTYRPDGTKLGIYKRYANAVNAAHREMEKAIKNKSKLNETQLKWIESYQSYEHPHYLQDGFLTDWKDNPKKNS